MVNRNDSNTWFVTTTTNEVTQPAQPAFLAYLGTTDSNVTGNNTQFNIGSGNALTEVFDQNADFVTTGTFTAPVTGRYFLEFAHRVNETTNSTSWIATIQTSNRNYQLDLVPSTAQINYAKDMVVLSDMDAADTAFCWVKVNGVGADTSDIIGGADCQTRLSGYLAV